MYIEDWKYIKDEIPKIPVLEDGTIDENCDALTVLICTYDGTICTDEYSFHLFTFDKYRNKVEKWTYLPHR